MFTDKDPTDRLFDRMAEALHALENLETIDLKSIRISLNNLKRDIEEAMAAVRKSPDQSLMYRINKLKNINDNMIAKLDDYETRH